MSMKYPMPELTPRYSAGTRSIQSQPIESRRPESMSGTTPGTTTLRIFVLVVPPRESATLSQSSSRLLMPCAVLKTRGQTPPMNMMKTGAACPPLSNVRRAIGNHATGDIIRRNWNETDESRSAASKYPTRTPSGRPTASESARAPTNRVMLARTCWV